jgi:hypothetical protein
VLLVARQLALACHKLVEAFEKPERPMQMRRPN